METTYTIVGRAPAATEGAGADREVFVRYKLLFHRPIPVMPLVHVLHRQDVVILERTPGWFLLLLPERQLARLEHIMAYLHGQNVALERQRTPVALRLRPLKGRGLHGHDL